MRDGELRGALVLALVLGGGLALGAPTSAVAAENSGGIVVDVTDDGSTPSPSPSPSAPGTGGSPGGGGTTGGSTGGAGGRGTSPAPGAGASTGGGAGGAPATLPGARVGLAAGGITSEVSPNLLPGNGSVTLSVVVRNTSSQAFDADARFVLRNLFGQTIGEVDAIPLGTLEPDQSREVSATIDDPGQGVFVRGYATITPPEKVGDTELSPVSREALIFVPPYFSLAVIVGLGALGGTAWWVVVRARREEIAAASLLGGGA